MPVALTESGSGFDVGAFTSSLISSASSSVGSTFTALIPIIITVTIAGFCINKFKKYVK